MPGTSDTQTSGEKCGIKVSLQPNKMRTRNSMTAAAVALTRMIVIATRTELLMYSNLARVSASL